MILSPSNQTPSEETGILQMQVVAAYQTLPILAIGRC
jgi:hypothetical protein